MDPTALTHAPAKVEAALQNSNKTSGNTIQHTANLAVRLAKFRALSDGGFDLGSSV